MIVYRESAKSAVPFDKLWSAVAVLAEAGGTYQFKGYPAADPARWRNCLKNALEELYLKDSTRCYVIDGVIVILDINPWDEAVFGFPISSTRLVLDDRKPTRDRRRLVSCIKSSLAQEGVKFVTARPSSDDLDLINAFLGNGFSYIENILWPVLDMRHLQPFEVNREARYYISTDPSDLPQIKDIARTHQYGKGHFHCESRFDAASVSDLYVKWAETSFNSDDQVVVVKEADTVVGYFVCAIDTSLTRSLGVTYGRLKSLALSEKYRGKKYGISLFYSTLDVLKRLGADYVDSGYASKNHTSAYLHTAFGFHSVFEQVTLHAWL